MLRSLFALTAVISFAGSSGAQLPPIPPPVPSTQPAPMVPFPPMQGNGGPEFLLISGVNKEKQTVAVATKQVVPVAVQKEVAVTVLADGRPVTEKRTVQVTEYQFVEKKVEMSLKGVQGTDGAGNKLTEDQLWERMASRKAVVISRDREGLNPSYRDVIAKDAVVLIMPQQENIGPRAIPAPLPDPLPLPRLPPEKN